MFKLFIKAQAAAELGISPWNLTFIDEVDSYGSFIRAYDSKAGYSSKYYYIRTVK